MNWLKLKLKNPLETTISQINSMKLFGIKLKEVQVIEIKRLREKVYKKVAYLNL